jgi:hypothetical protein
MLTVFIWQYRGKSIAWGHASLLVDQTYMSWWPEARGRIHSKISNKIYTANPIRNRKLNDDVADEGQHADYQMRIDGLDERAIKDWWQSFGLTRDGQLYQGPLLPWETLAQNCSTVAARGLSIGGGDKYAPWRKAWNVVWIPNDVLMYATAIKAGSHANLNGWK